MACSRHFAALMRKNALLRWRSKTPALMEIALPIGFIVGMWGLSTLFHWRDVAASAHWEAAQSIPPAFATLAGLALAGTGGRIAVSSTTAAGAQTAAAFHAWASDLFPGVKLDSLGGGALTAAAPTLAGVVLPAWNATATLYPSESAVNDYIASTGYSQPGGPPPIFASIVFNDPNPTSGLVDYVVRLNSSAVPTTSFFVNIFVDSYSWSNENSYLYAEAPGSSPLGYQNASSLNPSAWSAWQLYDSVDNVPGFQTLQLLVDRFVIGRSVAPTALDPATVLSTFTQSLTNLPGGFFPPLATLAGAVASLSPAQQAAVAADVANLVMRDLTFAPQQVDVVPFPSSGYRIQIFYQFVLGSLGVLFVIGYNFPVTRTVRALVEEKETKMRESMRQMGLSDAALYGSHFLTAALSNTVVAFAAAVIGLRLFPASSFGYVFFLFWSWGVSVASYSIFISVFFLRAKVAATISGILFIAGYLPNLSLTDNTGIGTKAAASLLAPTAFLQGISSLANLEASGVGAHANTVGVVVNGWSLSASYNMLILDALLYLLLAYYAEQCMPAALRDWGTPRPLYFPFTPSYWREVFGLKPAHGAASNSAAGSGFSLAALWGAVKRAAQGGAGSGEGAGESLLHGAGDATPASSSKFFEPADATFTAKEAAGRCVSVKGLRKEFNTPDGTKVAVAGVDLTMLEGEIFVLLGHNGAGKTTTISMLTGLIPPTAGSATVFGRGLEDMGSIRRELGVCPQHDVLWPELTVLEHLRLFGAIKGVPAAELDVEAGKALQLVGLTEKRDVQVAALSGGQKRKLHVAIAFSGGSRVVVLDEPTSGMDPYSRRSTWNILQSARAGRVILLTTHFMDEADILGDRIAIMAEGRVQCCGSPLYLKQSFGVGYSLAMVRSAGPEVAAAEAAGAGLVGLVRRHVPSAVVSSSAGGELTMRLPMTSAKSFPALLRDIEGEAGAALGVRGVGLHVTSVEDVFLRVAAGEAADGHGEAPDGGAHGHGRGGYGTSSGASTPATPASTSSSTPEPGGDGLEAVRSQARAELSPAQALLTHTRATWLKRAAYARRDLRSMACILLIPILSLLGGLSAILSQSWTEEPSMEMSTAQFNLEQVPGRLDGQVPAFPDFVPTFAFKSDPAAVASSDITALVSSLQAANYSDDGGALLFDPSEAAALDTANTSGLITASSFPLRDWQRMGSFLLASAPKYAASKYGAIVFTGRDGTVLATQDPATALGPASSDLTYSVLINTTAWHAGPIFTNLVNTAALRRAKGWAPGSTPEAQSPRITVRSQPLPLTPFERANALAAQSFAVTQVALLSISFVSGAFVYTVVREREVAAKHQQLISGISLPAYWLGNLLFDYLQFLLPAALALMALKAFNVGAIMSTDANRLGALVVSFLAYGLSGTAFSYTVSHMFSSPSGGASMATLINILQYAATTVSVVLLQQDSTCVGMQTAQNFLQILPFYAFGTAMSRVAFLESTPLDQLACDSAHGTVSPDLSKYTTPSSAFALRAAGGPLLYLFISAFFWLALALAVDVARTNMAVRQRIVRLLTCSGRSSGSGSYTAIPSAPAPSAVSHATHVDDPDVAAEAERVDAQLAAAGRGDVESGAGVRDTIVLSHLRKLFAKAGGGLLQSLFVKDANALKVAVHDMSFGIPAGEVFGFLGINGAGKTTTLKMLSGDELPTSGTALLGGYDIIQQQSGVRRLLGYCPQFDALIDLLTTREHLQLYARIKGVPEADVPALVQQQMADFDLLPFANKLAGTLSGGNKRKLSVAIALIGRPPIIFLDEPSTGVDPVAKRFMWKIISRVATERKQCSIILTTHSMEEVEALCNRIGIMVNGRLRCLGTAQHLRNVHGDGFTVDIKLGPPSEQVVLESLRALQRASLLAPPPSPAAGAGDSELVEWLLPRAALGRAAAALGDPARVSEVSASGTGWAVAAAFEASTLPDNAIPAGLFATWWCEAALADAALAHVTGEAFPGCRLTERQGLSLKFRVPTAAAAAAAARVSGGSPRSVAAAAAGARGQPRVPLAELFEVLEAVRARFGGDATSVTLGQTSLEEIFNAMAADGNPEAGVAHGFQAN